jgi:hypothetical protein
MTAHWTENTRLLKILISVMTLLLVAGLIAMVVGIAKTSSKLSDNKEKQDKAIAARTDAEGVVEAAIPFGAKIISIALENRRALLHLRVDGVDYLMTLDTKTGARKGFVRLTPKN